MALKFSAIPSISQRSVPHTQQGLSLVEVLIVVGIVGILMAISVPNVLSQLPKYRLNGAARQLMGELMAARMKAVSQNKKVRIFFPDNHQYKICDDANGDNRVDDCEGDARIKDIQANYHDVTIDANRNPMFDPTGIAAVFGSICLTNKSGEKKVVIAITGRVKIKDTCA